MVSRLCTLLLDQYDEKERLQQQLRAFKESTKNNNNNNNNSNNNNNNNSGVLIENKRIPSNLVSQLKSLQQSIHKRRKTSEFSVISEDDLSTSITGIY